jgi:hypothetical protein
MNDDRNTDLNLLRIGRRDLIAAGLGAATIAAGVAPAPAQAQQAPAASPSPPAPSAAPGKVDVDRRACC